MPAIHAICYHCGKSIFVNADRGDFLCPNCGKPLTYHELVARGNVVNVAQAKADYAAAYEYFKSGDFVMAGRYFDKVRETDRNNFFAEYYYRLSDIRRKRQEGKLCGAEFVIALLMEPVEKMKAACQPISVKRGFLLHAFSEAESLLNALYDTIGVIYGNSGDIDSARKEYLIMGRDCRRLTMIDREAAMLDDSEVSGHVISICEIAINAIQRAVSFIPRGIELNKPSAVTCDEAKALYSVFIHFLRSVRTGYRVAGCGQVYADVKAYDKEAFSSIEAYSLINKVNAKRYLITQCNEYNKMIYQCQSAYEYIYNTIFVCPGGRTGNKSECELICDALTFAEKLLLPRAELNADGDVDITAMNYSALIEFSRKFNTFLSEMEQIDKSLLNERLEKIYERLFDFVRVRYNEEEPRMRREIEDARMRKNKRYFHYRNMLYALVCASAFGLTKIVPYTSHRLGDRVRLIKAGRQAAEDLLYMFGYNLEEIEKVPKYSALTDIYACMNTDLKSMS